MDPSWIKSRKVSPRPRYDFAIETTNPLGQRDLLLGGQQRHAADRAQVQAQRIQARLDREIDLDLLRGGLIGPRLGSRRRARLDARGLRLGRPPVRIDDVDALVVQVGMQLLDLLLGDLRLLEPRLDLVDGQISALLPFGNQRSCFVELRDRSIVT
jgi:hypothetical protein